MKRADRRLVALKVLDQFIDNMGYWQECDYLADGLSDEEIQEVEEEVCKIQNSIRNRYKLSDIPV